MPDDFVAFPCRWWISVLGRSVTYIPGWCPCFIRTIPVAIIRSVAFTLLFCWRPALYCTWFTVVFWFDAFGYSLCLVITVVDHLRYSVDAYPVDDLGWSGTFWYAWFRFRTVHPVTLLRLLFRCRWFWWAPVLYVTAILCATCLDVWWQLAVALRYCGATLWLRCLLFIPSLWVVTPPPDYSAFWSPAVVDGYMYVFVTVGSDFSCLRWLPHRYRYRFSIRSLTLFWPRCCWLSGSRGTVVPHSCHAVSDAVGYGALLIVCRAGLFYGDGVDYYGWFYLRASVPFFVAFLLRHYSPLFFMHASHLFHSAMYLGDLIVMTLTEIHRYYWGWLHSWYPWPGDATTIRIPHTSHCPLPMECWYRSSMLRVDWFILLVNTWFGNLFRCCCYVVVVVICCSTEEEVFWITVFLPSCWI